MSNSSKTPQGPNPEGRPLFRRQALEALDTPEQLNQAIRVTSARSWLALLAVLLVLLAGVLWSFYGQLPDTATSGTAPAPIAAGDRS